MERLFDYNNEPFMFLEGGTGLNEDEDHVYKRLVSNSFECWALENLYDKPERLGSIQFLKPKVLIFGTTGVYEKELKLLIDFAYTLDLSSIEKVILTLNTERDIRGLIKPFKEKYPNIMFYKFKHFFTDKEEDILIERINNPT